MRHYQQFPKVLMLFLSCCFLVQSCGTRKYNNQEVDVELCNALIYFFEVESGLNVLHKSLEGKVEICIDSLEGIGEDDCINLYGFISNCEKGGKAYNLIISRFDAFSNEDGILIRFVREDVNEEVEVIMIVYRDRGSFKIMSMKENGISVV